MTTAATYCHVAIAVTVVLPGFATAQESTGNDTATEVSGDAEGSVERFRGFDIQGPIDARWRIIRSKDAPHIANFDFAFLSERHSFIGGVQLRGLPRTFGSHEELKAFVDSKLREHGPRGDLLFFHTDTTEIQGRWAIRYELRFLDRNPVNSRQPLVMQIKGYMYLHPYWKEIMIDACYSERGTEEDLDGTLDPIGEDLISRVVATQIP